MADYGNEHTSPFTKVVLSTRVASASDTPMPLSFINDNNTGIYQPTVDQLAIACGGILAASMNANNTTINGYLVNTLANYSAVTGSIAAATVITTPLAYINSAVANGAITLPLASTVGIGGAVIVFNAGANAIRVYASGADTIDGNAAAVGVPLTNAKRSEFLVVAAATYISAQLGAVSA